MEFYVPINYFSNTNIQSANHWHDSGQIPKPELRLYCRDSLSKPPLFRKNPNGRKVTAMRTTLLHPFEVTSPKVAIICRASSANKHATILDLYTPCRLPPIAAWLQTMAPKCPEPYELRCWKRPMDIYWLRVKEMTYKLQEQIEQKTLR